jgi:hypothetical protein
MALLQKGYLGATPLWRDLQWYELYDSSPLTSGQATITANTSAHTKGGWTQLIASSAANASFVTFQVTSPSASGTNTAALLDIGIGASGSETPIAENIAIGGARNTGGINVSFPIQIPSGSRISARLQSVVTGGRTCFVNLNLVNAGNYNAAPTAIDVIGGDTATSKGIEFSGASGTWVEGIASTSQSYRAVLFVPSMHTDSAEEFSSYYTLGVGAAGSEVGFGDYLVRFSSFEFVESDLRFVLPRGRGSIIPAGSRIAVKHPIAADPSKYGFTLIGIP